MGSKNLKVSIHNSVGFDANVGTCLCTWYLEVTVLSGKESFKG